MAVAALAACGESKSDTAMNDICSARADISKQVDQLEGLTLTSGTTNQVTDSLKAIRGDLAKIGDARKDLSAERRKDVQSANAEFVDTLRETAATVGRSASVESAGSQLEAAFGTLKQTYQSTFGKLDCSS
jgi:hypothetical protein